MAVAVAAAAVLVNLTLVAPASAAGYVTISSPSSSYVFGQAAPFTVTVARNGGSFPTGTVQLRVDGTAVASANLVVGTASFSISTMAVGTHSVVGHYNGGTPFIYPAGSSNPLNIAVAKGHTATVLDIDNEPVPAGVAAVLTARATRTDAGQGTLAGTTTFTAVPQVGSPVTAAIAASAGGVAAWSPTLPNGTWTVTATYGGNAGVLGSSAPGIIVHVGGATVAGVIAGAYNGCSWSTNGTAKCWGRGAEGQLGNGASLNSTTPVSVSGLTGVTRISIGAAHMCALISDGTVRCWGDNGFGQLGNGATVSSNVPVTVPGITGAIDLAVGGNHTCVLLGDATGRCWGDNDLGQLGNGTTTTAHSPVVVTGLTGATSISTAFGGTCARISDGTVRCWGSGVLLGNGSTAGSTVPVAVGGLSGVSSVRTGEAWHACATIAANGTVKCWGDYSFAPGSTATPYQPVPTQVSGLTGATTVDGGSYHACSRVGTSARCWGANGLGQLGNGTTTNSPMAAVTVSGLTGVTSVSAGATHSCALQSNGSVKCWGEGSQGALGTGSTANAPLPVTVHGL